MGLFSMFLFGRRGEGAITGGLIEFRGERTDQLTPAVSLMSRARWLAQ
jgi:hypothetical protein